MHSLWPKIHWEKPPKQLIPDLESMNHTSEPNTGIQSLNISARKDTKLNDYTVGIIDQETNKNRKLRLEEAWIHLLNTVYPNGLNAKL